MKKIFYPLLVLFTACNLPSKNNPDLFFETTASLETTPVKSSDDAADDICIWIHPTDVEKSTIIGTNKKQGLCVYNLSGKLLYHYSVGKVNNVDIRNNFNFNENKVALVTASNRTNNTITTHVVNKDTGELINVSKNAIQSKLKEVYGLCMYQNNQQTYVFVSGKDGKVEQWHLFDKDKSVVGELMKTFKVGSQTEGMVADDELGTLYIAEENIALWKYDADHVERDRVLVAKTSDVNMKDDFEGVTIYKQSNNTGYVILSSQGNNSYAVFDRVTQQYIKSFTINDGKIDGTNDTDGIDVTSVSFKFFPKGFFIAQDGENKEADSINNQNFKIVDFNQIWQKITN